MFREGKRACPAPQKHCVDHKKRHQLVRYYGLNAHQMKCLLCLNVVVAGATKKIHSLPVLLLFIYKCRINPLRRRLCRVRRSSTRHNFSFDTTATRLCPVATSYYMSLLILVRGARHHVFLFLETGRKHRNVTGGNQGAYPGRSSVVRIGCSQ